MEDTIRDQIAQYCNLLNEWNVSYEEYAKSVGLSFTSLSILNAMYRNPGCTQKELAEGLFLPKQTVNAVITSFLKNGWIQLEELPEDRRNKTVCFTQDGMEAAEKIVTKVRECERKAMSRLSKEQREALLTLTEIYIHSCSDAMRD